MLLLMVWPKFKGWQWCSPGCVAGSCYVQCCEICCVTPRCEMGLSPRQPYPRSAKCCYAQATTRTAAASALPGRRAPVGAPPRAVPAGLPADPLAGAAVAAAAAGTRVYGLPMARCGHLGLLCEQRRCTKPGLDPDVADQHLVADLPISWTLSQSTCQCQLKGDGTVEVICNRVRPPTLLKPMSVKQRHHSLVVGQRCTTTGGTAPWRSTREALRRRQIGRVLPQQRPRRRSMVWGRVRNSMVGSQQTVLGGVHKAHASASIALPCAHGREPFPYLPLRGGGCALCASDRSARAAASIQ